MISCCLRFWKSPRKVLSLTALLIFIYLTNLHLLLLNFQKQKLQVALPICPEGKYFCVMPNGAKLKISKEIKEKIEEIKVEEKLFKHDAVATGSASSEQGLDDYVDRQETKDHENTNSIDKLRQSITEKLTKDIQKSKNYYSDKKLEKYQGLTDKNGQFCPFDVKKVYEESELKFNDIKPLLSSIRKDKFLLNLTPFGPNNQLRGFRDTIFLSIYLNRSIILPPFFKHSSDPAQLRNGYYYQHHDEKFDSRKLAELLPVVPFGEKYFNQACPDGIDDALLVRKDSNVTEIKRFALLEFLLGTKLFNDDDSEVSGSESEPGHSSLKILKAKTHLPTQMFIHHKHKQAYLHMSHMVKAAYNFDNRNSRCVLWLQPYRNMEYTPELLQWSGSLKNKFETYDSSNETDLLLRKPELAARVILATSRPENVVLAANEFLAINKIEKGAYGALHWRYDFEDFGNHCRKLNIQNGICGVLNNQGINATKIGENLANRATQLASEQVKVKTIFIAAPPKEQQNVQKMKEILLKNNIQAFDGKDVQEFFSQKYRKCPDEVYNDQIHDFQSLVEMEIASQSLVFWYAKSSSWSRNINQERLVARTSKLDESNEEFLGI